MNHIRKYILRTLGSIVMVPLLLVLFVVLMAYCPPVQKWLVNSLGERMENQLGMRVHIEDVRITPFLDLVAEGVSAVDAEGDTLIRARRLTFDVAFFPLLTGRADIDGFQLAETLLNTKSLIKDLSIVGRVGELTAEAKGIEWTKDLVHITDALLRDADLYVALTDTAAEDTTSAPIDWVIDVDKAQILRTRVHATLPADSLGVAMGIDANVQNAAMSHGHFDLCSPLYAFRQLHILGSEASVSEYSAVPYRAVAAPDTLLSLRGISTTIDTLCYNQYGALRCGVSQMCFEEIRHGLSVRELSGTIYADSNCLRLPVLRMHTPHSRIEGNIELPWAALRDTADMPLHAELNAALGNEDLLTALYTLTTAGMIDASLLANPYLRPFLSADVNLQTKVHGTMDHIYIDDYQLVAHSHPLGAHLLSSSGSVEISDDFSHFKGRARAELSTANASMHNMLTTVLRRVDPTLPKNEFIAPLLCATLRLNAAFNATKDHIVVSDYSLSARSYPLGRPILSATGTLGVGQDFNAYSGDITSDILGGHLKGRFSANLLHESYDVSADINRLPLGRFFPGYDFAPFTGHIEAVGRGFDFNSPRTVTSAKLHADHLSVMGYDLSGLRGDVCLQSGDVLANLQLSNHLGHIAGSLAGRLADGYDLTAHLALQDLDMQTLTGMSDTLALSTVLDVHATATNDMRQVALSGALSDNFISSPQRSAELKDLTFAFDTSPLHTQVNMASGDLLLDASTHGDLNYIIHSSQKLIEALMAQIDNKAIDQASLRSVMPTATLHLHSGHDNPLRNFLYFRGIDVASVDLDLESNDLEGINGDAHVGHVNIGNLQLDTIYAQILHDEEGIRLRSTVHNYQKNNPNRFTASVDASLEERGFDALLLFKDAEGKTGIDLGVRAETLQGTATFTLYPQHPVFAYRKFAINDDNFISINRQGMIRADVHLVADDGTGLIVYSEPTDEQTNDITLSVYNINLRELTDVLPYVPKMEGKLGGDFHVTEVHGEDQELPQEGFIPGHSITAMGTVDARDFVYEGTPIGDLGAELIYMPKENGEHYADAFISYNGQEVGECSGVYYDNSGEFRGDIALNEFPLQMVNAFLDGTGFMMRGCVGGTFSAHGTIDEPRMNGQLQFADAHFYSPVYGVDFKMEERPIIFADSHLKFKDYLLSSGNTDLKINGEVNMSDLAKVRLDLAMKTAGFELINTSRSASSLVYGRMMANFEATVRGLIDNLAIRGTLDVLPSTDITYLLTNSPLTVDDRLADLITFTNFNDTTTVEAEDETIPMLYDVSLGVNIRDGAKFHCFLSNNGKSYVDIVGAGNLTLRTSQEGEMRLVGRYTIQEGRMNYELPVIPMKTFDLAQGSYVEFTGDMLNPHLNIQATQSAKAVVSDDGVGRNVNFIVGVDITRTLDDMGLAFTIEAPEDLNVQNQLATMSEEDRYKTAVALLATGMYVTENLTTGLKASNALNAFLQNEIQNIAGKALATFDLSFGMENGLSSAGTTTTDYSFRFSKRFLDDRISINIGGVVSTGQNAQNSATSFIDNISLEYRLDSSNTRYVHVFYDRDSRDPLEGSMMKAGAGLVLRRKTDRLGELFLFRNKKD